MAAATFNLVGTFKGLSLSSSSSSFLRGNLKELNTVSGSSVTFPARLPMTIESAHKKGSASTKNGRDSKPKHRGVKIYGDQAAKAGSIIVRQCGTKFHPGNNVGLGRDYTIYSLIDGMVKFEKYGLKRKKISVYPRVEVPKNPNSCRARRRESFRLQLEHKKAKKARKVGNKYSRKLALASPKKASAVAALC